MKNILYQYTPEILDIAKANDTMHESAANMFLNNIDDVGNAADQYHWHGADHLDYKSLQSLVPANGTKERADMLHEWDIDFDAHTKEISEFRESGDTEGLRRFMMALEEG